MIRRMLALATLFLTTGCAMQPSSGPSAYPVVECSVAYRSSPEMSQQDTQMIEMAAGDKPKFLQWDDLTLQVRYDFSEYESTTFIIDVLKSGEEAYLTRSLYQLSQERPLENQFSGGHGFTGLHYVHHPETQAELQFFCSAKES